MYEQEWRQERARDLALLTEHPHCRLLQRDVATLTPHERHARTLLQLLALLDEGHCDEGLELTLPRYAATDIGDDMAIDAALLAIGAHAPRRRLALYRRLLTRLEADGNDERTLRHLDRLISERYVDDDAIERQLWAYLHAHRDAFAALDPARAWPWAVPPRPTPSDESPADSGTLHVAVMRDDDATAQMIDAWLVQTGPAALHNAAGSRAVTHLASAHTSAQRRNSLPSRVILGRAIPGLPPYALPLDVLASDDAVVDAVAAHYHWALLRFPHTMHEHRLTFVTADRALADAFFALVHEHALPLLGAYRGIGSFAANARGAQFGERDGYGDAALVAADVDGCAPWLIAQFDASSGRWWLPYAARLSCASLMPVRNSQRYTLAAYRADDIAAYRALWSQLDSERNVSIATVSGLASPYDAVNAAADINGFCTFAHIVTLSQQCRWAYMHVWGGGSSEHHAMFHARDPRISARVHAHAARHAPERTYLSGRW